jgi:hypothetical protein
VSLTPLTNLHLRLSPRIFEKIWIDPNWILRGPGDTDLWKNLKSKISCQTPSKHAIFVLIFTGKQTYMYMDTKSLLIIKLVACRLCLICSRFFTNCYFSRIFSLHNYLSCRADQQSCDGQGWRMHSAPLDVLMSQKRGANAAHRRVARPEPLVFINQLCQDSACPYKHCPYLSSTKQSEISNLENFASVAEHIPSWCTRI